MGRGIVDSKGHILIIDDDMAIRKLLKESLIAYGYQVTVASNGEQAISLFFSNHSIQLIILDVLMPGMSGYEVLKLIRQKSNVPIIMLSARDDEINQLEGFHQGADDYISKPVSIVLLVARIQAILKRNHEIGEIYHFGKITIEDTKKQVTINGHKVSLTPKEYALLLLFVKNPNIVLSRDTILNRVWDYDYEGDLRTVDTHIKQLRAKLTKECDYIKTVRGSGYLFSE